MPEYLLALIISACIGSYGWLSRRLDQVDQRIERFEVKVVEDYATKEMLARSLDRLESQFLRVGERLETSLLRMEDKLDAHVSADRARIERIIEKYHLNKNND
jgi:septal ring factor EnvC (AmiA/AmiB activator)